MDLLSLITILRRHWVVSTAILAATLLAVAGLVTVSPPRYTGTASYLLFEPPAPPTAEQIAKRPKLGRINTDNPYVRYGDISVILNVVARRVDTSETREEVQDAGGALDFEVAPSRRYGGPTPIIDISATGPTADSVFAALTVLEEATNTELKDAQAEEGVSPSYFFLLRRVDYPEKLTLQYSDLLRLTVGVGGLGVLALLTAVGVLEGRRRRTELERNTRVSRHGWGPGPVGDNEGDSSRPLQPATSREWLSRPTSRGSTSAE